VGELSFAAAVGLSIDVQFRRRGETMTAALRAAGLRTLKGLAGLADKTQGSFQHRSAGWPKHYSRPPIN